MINRSKTGSPRSRCSRLGLLAVLGAVGVALIVAQAVLASGGAPSQAFSAQPGKLYSGDTSHQAADRDGRHREFWSIALRANDYVTLDWSQPQGAYNQLAVFTHDLNDFNLTQLNPIFTRNSDSTGHDEARWVVTSTSTYYLMFVDYGRGGAAYQFKVSIRRGVKAGDNPGVAYRAKPNILYSGDASRRVPDTNGTRREFWKIPLRGGRHVVIVWRQPVGGDVQLYLDPPGTNNSNYATTSPVGSSSTDSTGHAVLTASVLRSGTYFLVFQARNGGAYKFRVRAR